MSLRSTKLHVCAAAAAACALLAVSTREGAAQNPFAGLAGTWAGNGTINLANGSTERIRCRATYAVPIPTNMQQNLRCASDSYNFDLNGNVVYQGGQIGGTWTETTRNVGGSITGKVSGNQIQALVDGAGFRAGLSMVTRGNQQAVTITSQGSEFSGVTIQLNRR
jgi:hypothetical protein